MVRAVPAFRFIDALARDTGLIRGAHGHIPDLTLFTLLCSIVIADRTRDTDTIPAAPLGAKLSQLSAFFTLIVPAVPAFDGVAANAFVAQFAWSAHKTRLSAVLTDILFPVTAGFRADTDTAITDLER